MKISNDTLSVLKNFSTINTGIAVDSGALRTVSSQMSQNPLILHLQFMT
jgi:hypothetical protein